MITDERNYFFVLNAFITKRNISLLLLFMNLISNLLLLEPVIVCNMFDDECVDLTEAVISFGS